MSGISKFLTSFLLQRYLARIHKIIFFPVRVRLRSLRKKIAGKVAIERLFKTVIRFGKDFSNFIWYLVHRESLLENIDPLGGYDNLLKCTNIC